MNETETFQHYQVLKRDDGSLWELGRGAMGVTYKAFDVNLRCQVALKVISSQYLDSETARARFLREARAAAGLRHRNVASVYHLGNDAESFFYSMEYIDGDTVESLVTAQGPLPCAQALGIVLQVARALGAASKQGLVHRDIKPANIMVVRDDEEDALEVKVIDFGLARLAVSGEQSGGITMGGFVGTPQYASPEQIEEKDLDVRSDIYSLGITLWFMLAGQPPFTGTVFRISSQHLTAEPPFEQLAATVPAAVRDLLAHLLQKDPADRPQTAAKLRAEVEICLGELSGVSALSSAAAARRPDSTTTTLATGTDVPDVDAGAVTVVQGPAPKSGTIFAGRYQLAEMVGEGHSGKVYRAFDGRLDGRQVAVKVLHPDVRLSPQEFYHLQGDLGRLRDVPHPRLIDTLNLERIHGYKFAVMEWVNGFTLTRLLQTSGPLPVRDALRLLGQASDAAGHCSAYRLHRLELAPHQILTHFTEATDDAPPDLDALLARPITDWPAFTLKVDALAPAREASRAASPAGVRVPGRDTFTSIRGLIEGSYFHALGLLFHELLSGSTPVLDHAGTPTPLSALSEEANAVLRQAFSTNPGFATEREFFFALLDATGLRAEEVGMTRTVADQPSFRGGTSAGRSSAGTSAAPTAVPLPPAERPLAGPSTSAAGAITQARVVVSTEGKVESDSRQTQAADQVELPTARTVVPSPATGPEAPTLIPDTTRAPAFSFSPVPSPPPVATPQPEPMPAFVEPPGISAVEPAAFLDDEAAPTPAAEPLVETLWAEPDPEPAPLVEAKADPAASLESAVPSVAETTPGVEVADESAWDPNPSRSTVAEPLFQLPSTSPDASVGQPLQAATPPPAPTLFLAERIPVEKTRAAEPVEVQAEPERRLAPVVIPPPVTPVSAPIFAARTQAPAPPMARSTAVPDAAQTVIPGPGPGTRVSPPAQFAPTIFPAPPVEPPTFPTIPASEVGPSQTEEIPAASFQPAQFSSASPAAAAPLADTPVADEIFADPDPGPGPVESVPPRKKVPLAALVAGALALFVVGAGIMMLGRKSPQSVPTTGAAAAEKKVSVKPSSHQQALAPPPETTPVPVVVAAQTPIPAPMNVPTATPLSTPPPSVVADTPPPAAPTPDSTPTPTPAVASTPPQPPATSEHPGSTAPTPRLAASPAPTAKAAPTPTLTPRDPRHLPTPAHPPTPAPKAKPPVNKPTPRPPGKGTPPPNDDVPGFMR